MSATRQTPTNELVSRNVEALKQIPEIEAIGLAGSYALGTEDEFSDIDLMVIIKPQYLNEFVDCFADILQKLLQPLVVRYIGHWRGFGFCYTLITPAGEMVEYFLNSSSALPRTGMSVKTRLVFDRTGRATNWLALCAADVSTFEWSRDGREALGDFLAELRILRKFAARHDLLGFSHHLVAIRSVMVSLVRAIEMDVRYLTYGGDRNIERDLGLPFTESVLNTIPRSLRSSELFRSTESIMDHFLAALQPWLGSNCELNETVSAIVKRLRSEIEFLLSVRRTAPESD